MTVTVNNDYVHADRDGGGEDEDDNNDHDDDDDDDNDIIDSDCPPPNSDSAHMSHQCEHHRNHPSPRFFRSWVGCWIWVAGDTVDFNFDYSSSKNRSISLSHRPKRPNFQTRWLMNPH